MRGPPRRQKPPQGAHSAAAAIALLAMKRMAAPWASWTWQYGKARSAFMVYGSRLRSGFATSADTGKYRNIPQSALAVTVSSATANRRKYLVIKASVREGFEPSIPFWGMTL